MLNRDKLFNADVGLFYDSSYVDVGNSTGDEATNVKKSLESFSHVVTTFVGTSAATWNYVTKTNDVIAIPELQKDLLVDPGVAVIIKQFVMNGGTLIVFQDENNVDFINSVFGTTLDHTSSASTSTRQSDASGTTFSGGPNTIPDNAAVDAIGAGMPPGSESYYDNVDGNSTVMSFQVGKGQITYLGWDWQNSLPPHVAGQDGGWQSVLDRSISETDGKVLGNTIKGTKSDDKVTLTKALKGKKATDQDDYIKLKKGDDKAKAGDGADMIFGAKGEDKLIGQDGNDWLSGQHDNDILKGGAGMDCFVFETKLSKAGVDFIKDFKFDEDRIVLKQKYFSDLSIGQLSQTEFNDHIDIKNSGIIEYNGDAFARVKPGLVGNFLPEDFVVIS